VAELDEARVGCGTIMELEAVLGEDVADVSEFRRR